MNAVTVTDIFVSWAAVRMVGVSLLALAFLVFVEWWFS